jgi:hypothetical protein
MNRLVAPIALVIGAVVAAALAVQAWNAVYWSPVKPGAGIGSIQAVTLVNGQVFFGTLRRTTPGAVMLGDVFGLAVNVDQQNNQRTAQVIRRRTAAVHGPVDMVIPTEKILLIESVGKGSAVANAIASLDAAADNSAAPPQQAAPANAAPQAAPAPVPQPPAAQTPTAPSPPAAPPTGGSPPKTSK